MSFTLTARGGSTLAMTISNVSKDGPEYVSAESTPVNRIQLKARSSNVSSATGIARCNLELIHTLRDAATGKLFTAKVGLTLSRDNGYPWTANNADYLITSLLSYIDSEATAGKFMVANWKM